MLLVQTSAQALPSPLLGRFDGIIPPRYSPAPMNLPNLPTDNLGKFMAIAGLALIGYCGFFAYQQVWELELQILRTEVEENIIAEELKILNKSLDRLIEREKVTDSEWRDVSERALVVITKDIQTKGKKKENDLLNKQLAKHYAILWIGIIGVGLLCISGFSYGTRGYRSPMISL
jgi:hypothetical protein